MKCKNCELNITAKAPVCESSVLAVLQTLFIFQIKMKPTSHGLSCKKNHPTSDPGNCYSSHTRKSAWPPGLDSYVRTLISPHSQVFDGTEGNAHLARSITNLIENDPRFAHAKVTIGTHQVHANASSYYVHVNVMTLYHVGSRY